MTDEPELVLEVVQAKEIDPLNYCYWCKHLLKPGQLITTVSIPVYFRGRRKRKKAKGNTNHVHKVHVKCKP